jgi:hypothetical protein
MLYNIKLHRYFIVQRLSESIAENLRRDDDYHVIDYYRICLMFLKEIGLEDLYSRALMREVVGEAYELRRIYLHTGEYTYHNGSGMHPSIMIENETSSLVILLQHMASGYVKEKVDKLKISYT